MRYTWRPALAVLLSICLTVQPLQAVQAQEATPTAEPTPTEAVTPEPTATDLDIATPTETETAEPRATVEATAAPSETPTDVAATATEPPTPSSVPTEPTETTPEASATPQSDEGTPGQTLPFIGEVWGTTEETFPAGAARSLTGPSALDAQSSSSSVPFSSSFSGHQEGLFVADVDCAYGTIRVQGTYTITAVLGGSTHFDVAVHYDGTSLNVMSLDTFAGATSLSQYQLASRDLGSHAFDQTWAIYPRAADLMLWTNDVEGTVSGTYTCQPYSTTANRLTKNLAAYYPLDETQGARFNAITETLPLLNHSTVDSEAGVVGNAARFVKAETDYLVTGDDPLLRSGDKDFTVAAWIKPTSYNFSGCGLHYITKLGSSYDYTLSTAVESSRPDWVYQTGAGSIGLPNQFTLNEWTYVVAGYDRSAHRVFLSVNGRPAIFVAYTASDGAASAGQFLIGAYTAANGQCGAADAVIDEVGVWNRMVQPAEILALYNNGNGCAFPFTACVQAVRRSSVRNPSAKADASICVICEVLKPVGRPINTLTGAVDYTATDLSFPALGGDIAFVRSYSTDFITGTTQLAPGWTHSLDTHLTLSDQTGGVAGQVLVKLHSANEFLFYEVVDPTAVGTPAEYSYVPYPGLLATLVRDTVNHVYLLTTKDQDVYTFKDSPGAPDHGKLISWTDAVGHLQAYTYDPTSGFLTRVDAGDRYLTLTYSAGRIQSIQDHAGRSVTYGYDANGDLTTVTDVRGQVWTYAYDGTSHRIASVTDPDSRVTERTEYYPDGRAWRQFNGANQLLVELTYTANPDGTTTVTVEDGQAHTSTLTYDEAGTLVSSSSATGTESRSFDENFHAQAVTDENGYTSQYLWSHDGQVVTQTVDALGNPTSFQYDALNNITRTVDALGNATTALYDGSKLTSTTNALGQQSLFTYTTAADSPQPVGLLKAVSDPAGNTTSFVYNAYGQPLDVTNASGQTMHYVYDALGRVTATTDYAGLVTRTEYNAAGQVVTSTVNYLAGQGQNDQNLYNLITVHDYDGAGHLRWTRDTEGRTDWTCYDGDARVIRTVQNASGDGGTPATDPCNSANYVASSDPAFDRISRTVYDDAGNVSATINAAGIVSRSYFDGSNRPYLTVQNFTGSDLTGTITSTIPAWTAAFPDRNLRHQTVYDPVGNVIRTIDNAGQIVAMCYDKANRPVKTVQNPSVTDPCDSYTASGAADQDLTTQTVYDAVGNVIASIDTQGRITRTYYDPLNRPEIVISNLTGQSIETATAPTYSAAQPDQNLGIRTYYDGAGRVYRSEDLPTGQSAWTCFDSAGRVAKTVQNATGNPCGSFTPSTDPDKDLVTELRYDSLGRQIATIDPLGHIARTYYDAAGRVTATVQNLTGQSIDTATPPAYDPAHPDQNVRFETTYDALGRTVTSVAGAGSAQAQTTRLCFDALGRTVKTVTNPTVSDPCGAYTPAAQTDRDIVQQTVYDAAGLAVATIDSLGHIARTYSDGLGRPVVTVSNLAGQAISVSTPPTYNSAYPDRNVRQTLSYDAAGRTLDTTNNGGLVTHLEYDSVGRVVTTTVNYVSGGAVDAVTNLRTVSAYDKGGNAIRSTDPTGVVTRFDFDEQNRNIKVIENYLSPLARTDSQNVPTVYTFDSRGDRLTITDALTHTTTLGYDLLGRPTTETDALNHTWTTVYNKLGQRVAVTDAKGQTVSFTYDGVGRLTLIDYPAGTADVTFTYDALGNQVGMADGTGSTNWSYDLTARPITITAPVVGAVAYTYDRLGNRTGLNAPGSKNTTYVYDALSRLTQAAGWASQTATYGYGAFGQVVTATLPNGVTTNYGYDAAQRQTSIAHSYSSQTLASYVYTLDANGNRTQAVEVLQGLTQGGSQSMPGFGSVRSGAVSASGARTGVTPFSGGAAHGWLARWPAPTATTALTTTIDYSYDPLARLTSAAYSDGTAFGYTYDGAGNRLTQTACLGSGCSPATTTYTYDNANRLASVNGVTYTYDVNGNLTADGARTYAYDAADRLTSLTQSGNTSTYAYNGQGDRVSQTVSGVTTRYTLDLASLYTQVLADGSTSYLYGLRRIGEQQTGGWAYHLTDALGSVRQLTTSAGAVSLARRFDPYGAPLTTAGSGSSIYGFTGEQIDPSGNVFLRARLYVPAMGRFLTRDSWVGDYARPLTLNRWTYAYGNPVLRTDPSGHDPCTNGTFSRICPPPTQQGADEYCYETQVERAEWTLPNASDLPNRESRSYEVRKATIWEYDEVRKQLYLQFSLKYIEKDGKIKDQVIMAMIIAGEFGAYRGNGTADYEAALAAVSNQYKSQSQVSNIHCGGACSVTDQLEWLTDVEAFYTGAAGTERWSSYFADAGRAAIGCTGAYCTAWMWGNLTSNDPRLTKSPKGVYYFEAWAGSFHRVLHQSTKIYKGEVGPWIIWEGRETDASEVFGKAVP